MKIWILIVMFTAPNGDTHKWPGTIASTSKQSCVALIRYISIGFGTSSAKGKLRFDCRPGTVEAIQREKKRGA